MQVEGEDGGPPQGCIGSEFAAGHRAAGKPVLERLLQKDDFSRFFCR